NGTFLQSGGSVSGLKGSIFAEHHSTVTYSGGEFVGVIGGDNSSALLLAAAAGVTISGVVEGFGVLSGVGAGVADISGSVGSVSWNSGSLSIGADKQLTVGGAYTQRGGSLVFNPTYSDYYQLIFNGTVSFGSLSNVHADPASIPAGGIYLTASSNIHVEPVAMRSGEGQYLYAISSEQPSGSFSFSYNSGGGVWDISRPEWAWDGNWSRYELGGNITEVIPSSPAATIAASYGHQGSWLLMDAIGSMLMWKIAEETPQEKDDTVYHFGSFAASGSKGSATKSDSSYDSSQSGAFAMVERELAPYNLIGAFYGYTQRSVDFASAGLDKEKLAIHTLGGTFVYTYADWFITDILSVSAGAHSAERYGNSVTASYNSHNIRNEVRAGYLHDPISLPYPVLFSPRVGLVTDYVSVSGYTDSRGSSYSAFSQPSAQLSAGVNLRSNYGVTGLRLKPFMDVSYSGLLLGRTVELERTRDGIVHSVSDESDMNKFGIELGSDMEIGVQATMRIAYIGSFSAKGSVNGITAGLQLDDLYTEFSLSYANSYGGGSLGGGDVNAFLGVKFVY
ncbi:MAG: autotransporter outer membrane beta-barrel domain-containing protein, partial [Deltaproteobacteria bacterium]|nr:autotransporter outer membrane beta-barrel domain-containing protein [Deltaproteobacteria bacterium]